MNVAIEGERTTAKRRLSDLPGPRGWPLVGNLPQLDLPSMHQQLEGWASVYGLIYRLRFGRRDVMVVAQPELVAAILRDRPEGGAGLGRWRR